MLIADGIEKPVNPAAPDEPETIDGLQFDTIYSIVVVAEKGSEKTISAVVTVRTAESEWNKGPEDFIVNQGVNLGELTYSFSETDPLADFYILYFAEGNNFSNAQAVINAAGTTGKITNAPVSGTIDGLANGTTYSVVVVAVKEDYENITSIVRTAATWNINTNVIIEESGLDTVVTWSFVNEHDAPVSPDSAITLTYKYSGLAVEDGKLTDTVISGNETETLASDVREYTINHGLIVATDIVVSLFDGEVTSVPEDTSTIELRLYNVAYGKASEYGALEMFSYANAVGTGTLIFTVDVPVRARSSTIINFDSNRNPVELYGSTFARGEGTAGGGSATQLREWYYDGEYLYGRSEGGNTNRVTGTGTTGVVLPATNWATTNSVLSGHTGKWTAFNNRFSQDPYGYIPYNVMNGYSSLSPHKHLDPTGIASRSSNTSSMETGRSPAPDGLLTEIPGGLTYHNGYFEFSIIMNGDETGNRTNIEWAGNVDTQTYFHNHVTFVIDSDMKFVKYNAFDRYNVTLLSATTNVATAMYFVYHEDNIDLNNYTIFRPHQTRPDHVNFVGTGVDPESVIAPNGDTATGNMVVASSRYAITLGWIANANATSKILVPKP